MYKKLFVTIIVSTIIMGCSNDDDIIHIETINNSVLLSSQEDVYSFVNEYKNYNQIEIQGNLIIGSGFNEINGGSDIHDISGLSNIIRVEGTLRIDRNPNLISTIGFENLSYVGGHLVIRFNKSLEKIEGFKKLETINILSIKDNDALFELKNSFNPKYISKDLNIIGNGSLKVVDVFTNLIHIGGTLRFSKNCSSISCSNEQLTKITFENLKYIGEDFVVQRCPNLETIFLNALEEIGGNLSFDSLPNLDDNINFGSLKKISKDLFIRDLSTISNMTSFHNLDFIGGSLEIINNNKLVNLNFQNTNYIERIIISDNDILDSCEGIFPNSLETNGVIVEWNDSLNDFCSIKYLIDIVLSTTNEPLISIMNNGANNTGGFINNYDWIKENCNN